MADIIVVGAGMGGLAAGLFCARRGHTVTIIERDAEPKPDATADEDFLHWERSGVPHARQGHTFLALSSRILRQEAPDVIDAVAARGAGRVPAAWDGKDENLLSRRMVYEGAMRRVVDAEPGITVLCGTSVQGLLSGGDLGGKPRVSGVRTSNGDLTADFVVDASGRRSHVAQWLAELGAGAPAETSQPCGFHYLTRHYRLRSGREFPSVAVPILTKLDYTKLVVFPGDNGYFQISVTVAAEDPLRHRLRDPATFQRFVEAVPLTASWVEQAEPTDVPRPMAGLEDRWRRLVGRDGPVAAGYVLLADAAMQTNPAFGRGVSLAFLHSRQLAATAEMFAADPLGYVAQFDEWTVSNLGPWFTMQAASTREQRGQLEAGVRHLPVPPPQDRLTRFVAALGALSGGDARMASVQDRFLNMLITPAELMSDRGISGPVSAFLAEHPDPHPIPSGPDRPAFEALVTGQSNPQGSGA